MSEQGETPGQHPTLPAGSSWQVSLTISRWQSSTTGSVFVYTWKNGRIIKTDKVVWWKAPPSRSTDPVDVFPWALTLLAEAERRLGDKAN